MLYISLRFHIKQTAMNIVLLNDNIFQLLKFLLMLSIHEIILFREHETKTSGYSRPIISGHQAKSCGGFIISRFLLYRLYPL